MYTADLIRDRRFWKISVAGDHTTTVSFGVLGSKGRSISRTFSSAFKAEEWARAAAAAKEAGGYAAAVAESRTRMTTRAVAKKRIKEEEIASLSAAKKLRRSPRTRAVVKSFTVKEDEALGEVDAHANVDGSIVTLDGEVCDVILAEVDTANNVDNFVILQLIRCDGATLPFVVFKRWGYTGEVGQIWRDAYKNLAAAVVVFTDLFREISGVEWGAAPSPTAASSNARRFNVMTQDYVMKRAVAHGCRGLWQYWVDDFVDGKITGWYAYTPSGNNMAEALYLAAQVNPGYNLRVVRSGYFCYMVDLGTMTQMNLTHGGRKVRHIRRVPPGVLPDVVPPQGYMLPVLPVPHQCL